MKYGTSDTGSMLKNQKGFALVAVMGLFMSAFVGFFALASMGTNHLRWQSDRSESIKAFYLAEAAVEHAKDQLRADFTTLPVSNAGTTFSLNGGEYQFSVASTGNANERLVTGTGYFPSIASPEVTHEVEVVVEDIPPSTLPDIFSNVLWASGDLNINGNNRTVSGEIFAGGSINCSPGSCSGVSDADPQAENDVNYAFPYLDMEILLALKTMSQSQGHYFLGTPSAADLPTTFYFEIPDGADPTDKGVPNIVFIENDGLNPGDLVLNGSDSVAGFYVVAGDYLSNPSGGGTATLNGAADLDGVIYVIGELIKNGGGNNTTVDGAVFAKEITLNGKSEFVYNEAYADSVEQAPIDDGSLDTLSWNQTD